MPASDVQLIETLRVEPGRDAPLLSGHWRRLRDSCAALGYDWPGAALVQAVQQHIGQLDPGGSHRLRLLLGKNGQYSLESSPLPATPQPVRLRLARAALQADPCWLRHKTTRRPWYAPAQDWLARHPEYFDVVYCNGEDEVCEGSRSNIYILDAGNVWLTPPLDCGLLPGVQRQALLDGGLVRESRITRRQLVDARAIRVSNALRGWLDATLG
ncbi:aminotransferase class IV [Pollutimonas bauzanensis]|uniref:4-amino-4-deoxychorismate lyase n=1 Tax=Pollutimonas bauzanensis TaxID=658167 RepID=A0A1M5WZH3_9BURK|nr:aminotransferase class IV [Pollutimonas bauzanensis]SHH92987.1 4-amino-4-deoxychorismate lyase [Pollutimonas bauzanensis]